MNGRRYVVQFTPVGWHVLDTRLARDPVAEFGIAERDRLNEIDEAAA